MQALNQLRLVQALIHGQSTNCCRRKMTTEMIIKVKLSNRHQSPIDVLKSWHGTPALETPSRFSAGA